MVQIGELFGETKEELREKLEELEETMTLLNETRLALLETRHKLTHTRRDRDEQRHLVDTHVNTERKLHDQASQVSGLRSGDPMNVFGIMTVVTRAMFAASHMKDNECPMT